MPEVIHDQAILLQQCQDLLDRFAHYGFGQHFHATVARILHIGEGRVSLFWRDSRTGTATLIKWLVPKGGRFMNHRVSRRRLLRGGTGAAGVGLLGLATGQSSHQRPPAIDQDLSRADTCQA